MNRLFALLRVPVALVMSCVVSLMSCYGTLAIVAEIPLGSGGAGSILKFLSPFAVGGIVGGWVFYLLMVGERDDLKSRCVRRLERTRRMPTPSSVAAMCLVLVFGAAAIWWGALATLLGSEGRGWIGFFLVLAIGGALLFGLPLALFLGIATAIARARSTRQTSKLDASQP